MDEQFAVFMRGGLDALADEFYNGNTREARTEGVRKFVDKELLFNFLEANDVSTRAIPLDKRTNSSPILLREEGGKVGLQPYFSAGTDFQRQSMLIDMIKTKYNSDFFDRLKKSVTTSMLNHLLEKAVVIGASELTAGAGKRVQLTGAEKDRLLNNALSMFRGRRGKEIDYRILNNPIPDSEIRLQRGKFSFREKQNALVTLKNQPSDRKEALAPYIAILERDVGKEESEDFALTRLDVSNFIGKYDLKGMKNREAIYDYWETVNEDWKPFQTAFDNFMEKARKTVERDSELHDILFGNKGIGAVEVEKMKYVIPYQPSKMSKIASDDLSVVALDDFFDEAKMFPKGKVKVIEEATYRRVFDSEGKDMGIQGEAAIAEQEEEERRLREAVDTLIEADVDPIYAYLVASNASGLISSPTTEKEFRRLRSRLKKEAILIGLGKNVRNKLEKYLDDLSLATVVEGRKEFFLPYQAELHNAATTKEDPPSNSEIEKFLEGMSSLISGTGIERPRGAASAAVTRESRATSSFGEGATAPFGGTGKTQLKNLKDAKLDSLFKKLRKATNDYFIVPSRSTLKPLANRFEWVTGQTTFIIAGDSVKDPFIELLRREVGEEGQTVILDIEQIRDIKNFLSRMSGLLLRSDRVKLRQQMKNFFDVISEIYNGKREKDIEVELGNFLHQRLQDNNLAPMKFITKNTDELAEEYALEKMYPFEAIYEHLMFKRDIYARSLGRTAENLINDIDGLESKLNIAKADEQSMILQAHDAIRKMLKKPVYHAFNNVDDYDDIQGTIELMKSNYNTDITAIEIESIVSEFDSMSNLSKKYGISTEGVYFLKATYR